jgi:hypothetical protein
VKPQFSFIIHSPPAALAAAAATTVSRASPPAHRLLSAPHAVAVGVTRLMDLKRDTRAKEEQMTLVRNRLERLKLEEQKVHAPPPPLFQI